MRKVTWILGIFLAAFLVGCGNNSGTELEESGLTIQKNGKIVQSIVEEFAESYYSEEELKAQAEAEAAEYNEQNGSGAVKVGDVKREDGVVKMTLTYRSAQDYAAFNDVTLFVGALSEAADKCDLNMTLKSAAGSASAGMAQLLKQEDYHIIIMEETGYVATYGDILYFTENVTPDGAKNALAGETEGLTYIVFR